MYDVIIIGGAAAGLTAGIYAARRSMKTLIITKDVGGQANIPPSVENYPGYLEIRGFELMVKFQEQAVKSGAEIVLEEVVGIEEKNEGFLVKTDSSKYEAKSLILAFGKTPRSLGVLGERDFVGKGVSYCDICDMPVFRDRTIAVVGGGNSALDAALNGSELAKKIYLIHRRDEFRGFESMVEKVKEKDNVEFILNSVVTEIKGEKLVKSIVVQNLLKNEKKEIGVDGIFIKVGYEVKTDFVKGLVKLDDKNQIVTSKKCETFYPHSDKIHLGIFAAGDLTDGQFKQIVTSAGEGAKAALQAYNYVHGIDVTVSVDWEHKESK